MADDQNRWMALSTLGFEFIFAVLIPGAVGWWIDRKLGSTPWVMIAGGLFGFGAGFFLLMRAVKESARK